MHALSLTIALEGKDSEFEETDIIINDSVHGHIQLDPLCVSIIDTPQFQRLRRLKQLGLAYYVFPGAVHTRFEHSIGVCHLAGRFVEILKANQKELDISKEDVLCVKIAGLCHDLGHGPFSHLFETFVNNIDESQPDYTHWKHEEASKQLLDDLIDNNTKVKDGFSSRNLKKQDKRFIKQLLMGEVINNQEASISLTGRGRDKDFLYQIVANKKNGIDVDKWDYFARDCHMLGIRNNFDHQRCMQVARVCVVDIEGNEEKHICFRDKDQFNMCEMFHTRFMLQYRAYKHKTVTLIDAMILDALEEANANYKQIPGIHDDIEEAHAKKQITGKNEIHDDIEEANAKKQIPGKNEVRLAPEMKLMSEATEDMVAYTHLTDDVLYDIGRSTDKALKKSRQIIDRIVRRDFYKLVGKETSQEEFKGKDIKKKMIEAETKLSPADFTVLVVEFDYGNKKDDPLDNVYYYPKSAPDKGSKLKQRSEILTPKKCCEWEIRVIYKKSKDEDEEGKDTFEEGKENVEKAFKRWKEEIYTKKIRQGVGKEFEESFKRWKEVIYKEDEEGEKNVEEAFNEWLVKYNK